MFVRRVFPDLLMLLFFVSQGAAVRAASHVRKTLRVVILVACGLLLQACTTVQFAYNQMQHLAYWQLNSYLDLSDAQRERARDELGVLHRWHRAAMLPRHADLLQKVQQQLPSTLSREQVCSTYDTARTQIDKVIAQAEPQLVWLATTLTDGQISHLQRKQADSNADWKKEWVDVTPDKLRELRFKQLSTRAETFYGTLEAPQKAALTTFIAQSSFEPQRTYAERLRRQKDLVEVLQKIAKDRTNTEQARTLVRGYLARFNASPDVAYQRYVETLVTEGCEGLARMHNTMTMAQRLKAVQSLQGYSQDFLLLAGR